MAFKSTSANFGTYVGLNSIDGVQVKIGDEFIPPKKVTLPMKLENSFHCHNPSEVLFMEYDFSLEESVIKWNEAYREAKKAHNSVETEKVGTSIETFVQQPQDEATTAEVDVAAAADKGADGEHSGSDALPSGDLPISVRKDEEHAPSSHEKHKETIKPVAPGLSTEILVPTQVPTTKPEEPDTSSKTNESFNLADFEREKEQDPFDNAELRVLNDFEELNKVLQNAVTSSACSVSDASMSASSDVPVTSVPVDGVVTVTASHSTPNMCGIASSAAVVTSSAGVPLSLQNFSNLAYYNKLTDTTAVSFSSQTVVGCHLGPPQYNYPSSVKDIHYPELDSPAVIPNGTPQKQAASHSYGFAGPNSFGLPPVASLCRASFPNSTDCAQMPFTSAGQSGVSGVTAPVGNGQRTSAMVSQTSYPFHLLSHGAAHSTTQEPFSAASGRMSSSRLRSASSTPDISSLSDRTPVHLTTSQTPPPSFRSQGAQDEIGKRKKSGVSDLLADGVQASTPPPAYEEHPSLANSVNNQVTSSQKAERLSNDSDRSDAAGGSSLPDPYPGMSSEARSLIDTISAMGFPRPRVARAVKKHGNDDKQVIDHLCMVARLSEKYPSDDVEIALNLYGTDEKKARKYLTLVTQFSELGFPAENVKEALTKSKLDENKTLDILTGNA